MDGPRHGRIHLTRYIKEIGRGRKAAGDLSRNDARSLFTAMLGGVVPDLQLGAILIALRVKGESLEELAGFAAACEASYNHLQPLEDGAIPVVIPSYNGARQLPNLVPLLALLLAREGIPVLIHGVMRDPGRVTTREVLSALGIPPATSSDEARAQLATRRLAFMPIEALAPADRRDARAAGEARRAQLGPHARQDAPAFCRPGAAHRERHAPRLPHAHARVLHDVRFRSAAAARRRRRSRRASAARAGDRLGIRRSRRNMERNGA